ncbi:MAG: alpha-keto acid decarboxylase family protein [Proteobacteria bacterium]|nr:alpha-keto acid decarboxylase family protein [Pseudomonadota bacterium]
MKEMTTIGGYLIHRLQEIGLKDIFGVPGDYVLNFLDLLVESPINMVGTSTENGAGFAADCYARVNGLGAVYTTYAVGGFNLVNAVAGAYAEKSPLIVISGAPGMSERTRNPLLHHRVRDFNTQRNIFQPITCCAEELSDPSSAPRRIDLALSMCVTEKMPVYIEIPRDLVDAPCRAPLELVIEKEKSPPDALNEALIEAADMLRKARRPVVLAGIEIHRFGLQNKLLALLKKSGYPVATTLLGKSVIRENHPQYIGVYDGTLATSRVRRKVEKADCILALGAFLSDGSLGFYTSKLDDSRMIKSTSDNVTIRYHDYPGVQLKEFIEKLTRKLPKHYAEDFQKARPTSSKSFKPQPKKPIKIKRFFSRLNDFLGGETVVISDVGDSLYGAVDLMIHRRTEFLSSAYYASMGFAIPAAIGAQINKLSIRPIVLVGDGAFQMTGQELSTIVRNKLNPIIFVLNNKGYLSERYIDDGPYNDVHEWAYHLMPQVLKSGWGCEVTTEGELEDALSVAWKNTKSFSIINVQLDKTDSSEALARLGKRLAASAKPKRKQ